MRWLLTLIFTAALYFQFVAIFYFQNTTMELFFIALLTIIGIANIVYAIRCATVSVNNIEKFSKMRVHMLLFKLLTVPFFVANFLLWVLNVVAQPLIVPIIGMSIWLLVPIGILVTYSILLVTSSYSISTVVLYWKSRHLSTVESIVHIVLQFIFVVDVIDAIYLFFRLKRNDRNFVRSSVAD